VPTVSTSYRDDGEADCPVPVVALLDVVPWFDAVGVWHAAKTPTIAQTKYPLRQLSITLTTKEFGYCYGRRKWAARAAYGSLKRPRAPASRSGCQCHRTYDSDEATSSFRVQIPRTFHTRETKSPPRGEVW